MTRSSAPIPAPSFHQEDRTNEKRFVAVALVLALAMSAVPAFAIFGLPSPEDLLIWLVLRPIMHRNQDTMLANQLAQLGELADTLRATQSQFTHLRDSALGQIGAITDPIQDLIATPTDLLTTTRSWANDFTGDGLTEMIGSITGLSGGTSFSASWRDVLDEVDTITDTDIRDLFPEQPVAQEAAVAAYQERRQRADRRVELAGVRADSAADLHEIRGAAENTFASIATLVDQDPDTSGANRTPGALTEGDALSEIAQLRLLIQIGQKRAADATTHTEAAYDAEVRRRELEALIIQQRTSARRGVGREHGRSGRNPRGAE